MDLNQLCQRKAELLWKIERLSDIIERDQQKVSRIDELTQKINEYNESFSHTQNRRMLIHTLIDDDYKLKIIQDNIYDLQTAYKVLSAQFVHLTTQLEQLKLIQFKVYASTLAATLKDNEPCPVCGSLTHPSVAPSIEGHEVKAHMDALEKEYEKVKDKKEEVYLALESKHQHEQDLINKITYLKKQVGIDEDLSKELLTQMLYRIDRQTNEKMMKYKKYENELIYLKKLSKSINDSILLLQEYKCELNNVECQLLLL